MPAINRRRSTRILPGVYWTTHLMLRLGLQPGVLGPVRSSNFPGCHNINDCCSDLLLIFSSFKRYSKLATVFITAITPPGVLGFINKDDSIPTCLSGFASHSNVFTCRREISKHISFLFRGLFLSLLGFHRVRVGFWLFDVFFYFF